MAYVLGRKKPTLLFPSVSGSVCTFNSQYAGLPLKSHTIALTATQSGSGTPSPDNVRTIIGYSAINIGHNSTANIFGGKYLLNAFIKANINQFVYDTDSKTLQFGAPNVSSKEMYGVFKPNTQYTFYIVGENSQANRNTNIRILYSDGTTTNIQWSADLANTKQTRVITSTAGKTVVGLRGGNFAGVTTLYYDECGAIEGVKTIDDFVAFGGTSYLIQIGSTVYGGEYDARTGVLVAKGIYWQPTAVSSQGTQGGNIFYRINIPSANTGINTPTGFLLCNEFAPASGISSHNLGECFITSNGSSFHITPTDQTLDTIEKMNTWLNEHPLEVVYELATPTTIQLPTCPIDTLEEVNNIWADTGETNIRYIKLA